jgi:hypothetical protein
VVFLQKGNKMAERHFYRALICEQMGGDKITGIRYTATHFSSIEAAKLRYGNRFISLDTSITRSICIEENIDSELNKPTG